MALTTPTLYTIPAFDATLANKIYFNVIGGDQYVANRLLIKINSNEQVVYNAVETTYKNEHTIPANTLTNGKYYVAQVKTYGVNEDTSDENAGSLYSSTMPFYCYTTPVITWTNQTSVIDNSNPTFYFSYSQLEDEPLHSYVINLYEQNILMSSSGVKYISSLLPSISYTVQGLLNNHFYQIEANGVTANGTQITTGKLSFTVSYYEPYSKQGFSATNDACNGWITIVNNVVEIISESYPSPPVYVKQNTAVDATTDKYYVKWSGMSQTGDFCIRIWGYDFNSNKEVFNYSQDDMNYNISLYRRDGYDYDSTTLQTFYELHVYANDNQPLFIYSNFINQPSSSDKVFICIKRMNNLYSLYIENLGS